LARSGNCESILSILQSQAWISIGSNYKDKQPLSTLTKRS